MSDYPRAVVRVDEDGKVYLDDPDALAMIAAVDHYNRGIAWENCQQTFDLNAARVAHFKQRIADRGDDPMAFAIVLLSVDDPHGGPLAEMLMPGYDWQPFRDKGETPYARGLAARGAIQDLLASFDAPAAERLQDMEGQIAVVVVDHRIARVFPA